MPMFNVEPSPLLRSLATRDAIAAQLYPLLQCITELRFAAKTAHWNIRSAAFIDIHKLLDEVESMLGEHFDDVGERLKVLGVIPVLDIREMGSSPMYDAVPQSTNDGELVGEIYKRLVMHSAYLVTATRACEQLGEYVTMDLLIQQTRAAQKMLYLLGQHLSADTIAMLVGQAEQYVKTAPRLSERAKAPKPMAMPMAEGKAQGEGGEGEKGGVATTTEGLNSPLDTPATSPV